MAATFELCIFCRLRYLFFRLLALWWDRRKSTRRCAHLPFFLLRLETLNPLFQVLLLLLRRRQFLL